MLRPDFHSTVTGWVWLDTLTRPIWWAWCKFSTWRLHRDLGHGDAAKGKRMIQDALWDQFVKDHQLDR